MVEIASEPPLPVVYVPLALLVVWTDLCVDRLCARPLHHVAAGRDVEDCASVWGSTFCRGRVCDSTGQVLGFVEAEAGLVYD